MALNPPMTYGQPCRVEGEYFVMKRSGVEFEFAVTGGNKYSGKGIVILTTCRIVAVNSNQNSPFKAFDIPLGLLKSEDFKQPIFGSNYIQGLCKPLFNLLPGDVKFKIWFTEGGCGTFVPAFLNMVNSLRKNQNKGHDEKLLNTIAAGQFAKTAYIDPNDPSVIFLEQPELTYNNVTTTSGTINTNSNVSSSNPTTNTNNTGFSTGNFSNTNYSNVSSNYQFNNNNNSSNFNNFSSSSQNQIPIQQNNFSNSNYMDNQTSNSVQTSSEININSYPSLNDININTVNNTNEVNQNQNQNISSYPENNLQNLNGVDINTNPNNTVNNDPKYFGFWGPQLQKNNY